MTAFSAATYVYSFLLLIPPTVAAQQTPAVEVFGGYSSLRLSGESRFTGTPAPLNRWNHGWNASGKVNVTRRIGLLADFSGHYGTWRLNPYTLLIGRVDPLPGSMRQHTFLFGPEVRLFTRDRLTLNIRALIGVAHTNRVVLPLRAPLDVPPDRYGNPRSSIGELTFPSANVFAASLGGAVDYRLTHRLSYRVIQS